MIAASSVVVVVVVGATGDGVVVRAATTFVGVGVPADPGLVIPADPGLVLRLSDARKALFTRICFDGLFRTVVEMR
jgi:hypothetical protein